MLCADHQATVSYVITLPLIKIILVYEYIYDDILPLTYEHRMNFP